MITEASYVGFVCFFPPSFGTFLFSNGLVFVRRLHRCTSSSSNPLSLSLSQEEVSLCKRSSF